MKVLLAIDIQQGWSDARWGQRNHASAELHMAGLFTRWRQRKWPIIHVQHLSTKIDSPLAPEQVGADFMDFARPQAGEKLIQKHVHSAFIGTDLLAYLKELSCLDLVLMGLTSDHCVSTTTRMAANYGFTCQVVDDACVAFERLGPLGEVLPAELVHRYALASLRGEFATIIEAAQA